MEIKWWNGSCELDRTNVDWTTRLLSVGHSRRVAVARGKISGYGVCIACMYLRFVWCGSRHCLSTVSCCAAKTRAENLDEAGGQVFIPSSSSPCHYCTILRIHVCVRLHALVPAQPIAKRFQPVILPRRPAAEPSSS